MREAWCSVPAKRGAHRVKRGKTAVQRYRFRAKAISVALKAAYELNGTEIRFVSSMLLQMKRPSCLFFFCSSYKEGHFQNTKIRILYLLKAGCLTYFPASKVSQTAFGLFYF